LIDAEYCNLRIGGRIDPLRKSFALLTKWVEALANPSPWGEGS